LFNNRQVAAAGKPVFMKMRKKADLPTKTCLACARPFAWRKKWARDWDQVKYCSDRCRAVGEPNKATSKREG
jgi:hypothetical protein